jgi:mRNA-degrading endonuclease YafQ of YafQ-DinJ toxin-antitoxin module
VVFTKCTFPSALLEGMQFCVRSLTNIIEFKPFDQRHVQYFANVLNEDWHDTKIVKSHCVVQRILHGWVNVKTFTLVHAILNHVSKSVHNKPLRCTARDIMQAYIASMHLVYQMNSWNSHLVLPGNFRKRCFLRGRQFLDTLQMFNIFSDNEVIDSLELTDKQCSDILSISNDVLELNRFNGPAAEMSRNYVRAVQSADFFARATAVISPQQVTDHFRERFQEFEPFDSDHELQTNIFLSMVCHLGEDGLLVYQEFIEEHCMCPTDTVESSYEFFDKHYVPSLEF